MSFIVRAVKGVVKAVVGVVKSVVKAVIDVAKSVINFAVQAFMPGMPDTNGAGEAERQQGVLLQREGSNINIPVIYGHRKVGGAVAYMETGSTNNRYLYVAYIFSEGLVEGLRELWIDDNPLPASVIGQLNGGNTVSIAEGKYNGRVTLRWSPGVYYSNPASSALPADLKKTGGIFAEAPNFGSNYYFNGLAVMFARYEWKEIKTQADSDANPFGGGVPRLQACILGRKVATLENSTSESYTYGGTGYAERYSTNPAEILLDYLRNPRYGKGLANAEINWDSFRTAARKCNQGVAYYGGGPSGAILTCNAVIDSGQTLLNNVKMLLQGFRGFMPYVQGQYKLRIEDAGNPTDILSGSATISAIATTSPATASNDTGSVYVDIIGDITYTGIERSAKYTQVAVTFVDPDQGWSNQQAVWPESEAERATYVATDGGRENQADVTMGTITNRYMALDFARLIFNKSRFQETCSITVSSRGIELEPGDIIKINGTILNFGDTPWRVVSMSYNDDMTVSLGCVRNPESIYPYTRLNEADTISGVFRPVGADINPPLLLAAGGGLGVTAPTTVSYTNPSQFTANATLQTILIQTNPPQSNVILTTGNTAVSNTTANSTSGTGTTAPAPNNPTTTAPPPPPPLNDKIDFTNITFTQTDGGVFARVVFAQPAHPLYEGIDFYYKRAIATETAWQYADVKEKPGPGNTVQFNIGPLIIPAGFDASQATYNYRAIVKYSTGERSTLFVSGQFTPNFGSGISVNPSETVQITASAWTVLTTTDTTSARNNSISAKALIPASGGSSIGSPGASRTIKLIFKDDVQNQPANWQIDGVIIYWKPTASTYWYKEKVDLIGTWVPGRENPITLAGDIGIVGGPTSYDFIFRWYYVDGKESTQQLRCMGWRVESPFATYPYDPSYGGNQINEASTAYAFTTIDNAPGGAAGAAANVSVGVNFIGGFFNNGANDLTMGIIPPAAADLASFYRGLSLQYRAVVPGGNPPLTVANVVPQINSQTGQFNLQPAVRPWEFDTTHEMIVTPIVLYPGGNKGLSNVSVRGVGYVHNRTQAADYPANNDWSPTWNFEQMDTAVALRRSGQPFPAGSPTVSVRECVVVVGAGGSDSTRSYINSTTAGVPIRLNQYFRIKFNKPAIGNYSKCWLYRRVAGDYVPTDNGGQYGYAKYTGLGIWEKIEITDVSHPPDGSGVVTVNFRGPVASNLFNAKYLAPQWQYHPDKLIDPRWEGAAEGQGIRSGSRPYQGISLGGNYNYTELLLIVETTSGLSDRAIRIVPNFASITSTSTVVNVIPTNLPTTVDWSVYNQLDSGRLRRLDEAVSAYATNTLLFTVIGKPTWLNFTTPPQYQNNIQLDFITATPTVR
jgi:hypothetical protein